MTASACIPDDVLRALTAGELTDEQATPWEEHLLGCEVCVGRTRALQSSDPLVEALQAGPTVDMAAEDATVVSGLVRKLADRSQWAATADSQSGVSSRLDTPTEPPRSDSPSATTVAESDPSASTAPLAVGAMLGPYRLLAKLGEGGMGAVYKAQHEHLDKTVALKVLPPHFTRHADAVARFKREMRAVGKLQHPNIVQAFDAGEIGGTHYLAMEFIEGSDLSKLVKEQGPVSIVNACEIIRQASQALAAAHAAGLVHRDIKPANLLLSKSGQVKVLDMGLALLGSESNESDGLTSANQAFGTPDYMAPEQWSNAHAADARTDLYALGCTLFYLLVGRAPYGTEQHRTTVSKMSAHVMEAIPDLAAARPDVPAEVAALYCKLLAKSPADRCQSAAELAAALAPYPSSTSKAAPGVSQHDLATASPTVAMASSTPAGSLSAETLPPHKPTTASAGDGQRGRFWKIAAAAGGAALLALLGFIIIKITNKDGAQTTLRFPEGIEADVQAAPGSKIAITQGDDTPSKTSSPKALPVKSKALSAAATPLDLSPPPKLGTWEMGPEPPWFAEPVSFAEPSSFAWTKSAVLPGILERPAIHPGVNRWNVDTVWPRGWVNVARLSPDGEWIAVGASDGHVRIFDAAKLTLHRLLPGAGFQSGIADLSWHPDSQRLAMAAESTAGYRVMNLDGAILWEERDHREASAIAWNHAGTQCAIAFKYPERAEPATAIMIRDAQGLEVTRFQGDHSLGIPHVGNLAWTPDDKALVEWHRDGKLRRWSLEAKTPEVLDDLASSGEPGHRLAIHSHGWLAVSTGKEIRIYDPEGKLAQQFSSNATTLCWNPDGNRLLCAGYFVTVWDRTKGAEIARAEVHGEFLMSSPDGESSIVAGSGRGAGGGKNFVRLSADLQKVLASTPGSLNPVSALAWSPDGDRLASGASHVGPLRLWDRSGHQRRCWSEPEASWAGWFAWRPDGQAFLGGSADFVWEGSEAGTPRKLYASPHLYWRGAIAFSPNGQQIALGLTNGEVQILDRNGQEIATMATGGTKQAFIAWHHGTNRIAVAAEGRPLMLCDPERGWILETAGDAPLNYLQDPPVWSPNGQLLSVVGNGWFDATGKRIADASRSHAWGWRPDSAVRIQGGGDIGGGAEFTLRSATDELLRRRITNGFVLSFAWSPRGNLIATGQNQSTITAWTEEDLQPYWHAVLLPDGKAATFSAAGELISDNAAEVDQYLVYYLERDDGTIETLAPAEFRKRIPKEAAAP